MAKHVMDRSMIAPFKAEERTQSERLYTKLNALILISPSTDELRNCVSTSMFLKSNPHSFVHVMHFLFRLLDPEEFKKRFFWPVTDKRAEAHFRAATVEYLNYLNEKHQLRWTNITSYLVIMPGGMRFIHFMNQFVNFVISQKANQLQAQLFIEPKLKEEFEQLNVARMRRQNEFLKEYADAYISAVDEQIEKLMEKTVKIKKEINAIAQSVGWGLIDVLDDAFFAQLEGANEALYEEKYAKPTAQILAQEKPLSALSETADRFLSHETSINYNGDALQRGLRRIFELYPKQQSLHNDTLTRSNSTGINMNSLIIAFNCIYRTIEESLNAAVENPCSNDFMNTKLMELKTDCQETEAQITAFQKSISTKSNSEKCEPNEDASCITGVDVDDNTTKNALLMKFIQTPPVRFDTVLNTSANVFQTRTRLALSDDFRNKQIDDSAFGLLLGSERKQSRRACDTPLANETFSKSRIIDPIQLLRTISKDSAKARAPPTAARTSKWQQRQCLLNTEIEAVSASSPNTPQRHRLPITEGISSSITPTTPFNSNNRTLVAYRQMFDMKGAAGGTSTGSFTTTGAGGGSMLQPKKLAPVKKLQNDSLGLQNISTSPSGRLESLVNIDTFEVPMLQLNDAPMQEKHFPGDVAQQLPIFTVTLTPGQNENDAGMANTLRNLSFNLSGLDGDESICNISDSVLNDVIM